MIRRFAMRASHVLAGAVLLATLALPAAAASEFSAQHWPHGARHMGRPGGPAVAPRIGGGGGQRFVNPGGPRPHVGGQPPHIGGTFRGPTVGFGPAWRGPYHRGHAFYRGRHHVRRGGVLLPLVGLGALGAIYLGSRYYAPYAYVDVPYGPACAGPTEDGVCELRLTEVPLETGGSELQCVAYCPQ